MENLFYYFGFLYIINCFYNLLFNNSVSSKKTEFNTSTTIDEVMASKTKEDNKPFTIVTVVTQLISVLGFAWFYLGTRLTDFIFFKIGFFAIIGYYSYVIIIGIIIGYNQTHNSNFTLYKAPKEKTITIPLSEIVEVIKIISASAIVINHFFI